MARLPTPISTRTHGLLDYLSAALLVTAPRLMGADRTVRRLCDGAAVGNLAYAALTDYERGAYPALSMKQHLGIDALEGVAFLATAWMLEDEPTPVRLALAGFGLFSLAAGSLTDRRAHGAAGYRDTGHLGHRTPSGAWIMQDGPRNQTGEEETMHPNEKQGRVAEAEWRRSRQETFPRNLARAGEQGHDRAQAGRTGESDWDGGEAGLHRAQVAAAGRNTHPHDGKMGPLDARKGHQGGQGI